MAKMITVVKRIATLGKRELTWADMDGVKKWDIRAWNKNKYEDGVRFTDEEMQELANLMITDTTGTVGNKELKIEGDEYILSLVSNGRTYTRTIATKQEMEMLTKIFVKALKQKQKSLHDWLMNFPDMKTPGRKATPKAKAPAKKQEEPKQESNIVLFKRPKDKEELTDKLVTDGNATYEQCEEKITKEMEVFCDEDSRYVLHGILELCKVDADFRNNVMRDDKDFNGAMKYMMTMCQKGYGYTQGNMGFMSRDMGLGFAIDYYNVKPVEPKKKGRKKKEA